MRDQLARGSGSAKCQMASEVEEGTPENGVLLPSKYRVHPFTLISLCFNELAGHRFLGIPGETRDTGKRKQDESGENWHTEVQRLRHHPMNRRSGRGVEECVWCD